MKGAHGITDTVRVDADSSDGQVVVTDAQFIQNILAHRLPCFGSEAMDAARCIVALQGSEVHHGDRFQQPGSLPLFLDRTACDERLDAPFGRTAVDAGIHHPAKVEGDAGVVVVFAHGRLLH